jgi:hypothetical protein
MVRSRGPARTETQPTPRERRGESDGPPRPARGARRARSAAGETDLAG